MVRLEKIVYEQLVNTRTLGRARAIGSPQKYFYESRWDRMGIAAHKVLLTGISGKIFRALEPFLARWLYIWPREIALSRGLALEDFLLIKDRELRRCMLMENILRQSAHPYMHVLPMHRRARYYKVERSVRGFIVPDWLRKEASERLLKDTVSNIATWERFLYQNFSSDMTPLTHAAVIPRLHPLELFNMYGLLRPEAWDRYFFNEVITDRYTEADARDAAQPFGKLDLSKEEDRRQFEAETNRFIKIYPGTLVREGESFDFKTFYAGWAVFNKKDTSRFDPALIESFQQKLAQANSQSAQLKALEGEKAKGENFVGTILPRFIRERLNRPRAFFN